MARRHSQVDPGSLDLAKLYKDLLNRRHFTTAGISEGPGLIRLQWATYHPEDIKAPICVFSVYLDFDDNSFGLDVVINGVSGLCRDDSLDITGLIGFDQSRRLFGPGLCPLQNRLIYIASYSPRHRTGTITLSNKAVDAVRVAISSDCRP